MSRVNSQPEELCRYQVSDMFFTTFDDVVLWAWNNYKIDLTVDVDAISETSRQAACLELTKIIETLE